ncbi:MAG: ComEC/Rec2 family competence protein [Candidatus Bipolaricaulota bacterium]|nr:ComEC/Rec2 family competence protein [Candidatus Bipolaricaulota bacterium]
MNPSLVHVAAAFAAGILLIQITPFVPSPGMLLGLAAGAAALSVLLIRFRRAFLVGFWISIAILGALRAESVERSYADLYHRAPFLEEVTGIVVSYPDSQEGRSTFVFAPDNLPARLRVTLFWADDATESVCYGDRLRLRGSVKAPPQFTDFDYRAYLAEQSVFAVMSVDGSLGIERLGRGGSSILRVGNVFRDRLLRRLDEALSAENAALARGLLFGETTALSNEVSDAFRRTGLSHVLAISGMNLAILLAGVWFVLRLVGLRPAVAYPLVGVSVLAILWLVGLPVSLVRAAIMFGFLALGSVLADLGFILRRSVLLSHGLAAAGVVILAIRPAALFDVGFQLSFGATAAILAWATLPARPGSPTSEHPTRRTLLRKAVTYGSDLVAVSLAAQAGTAPFLAWHFGMLYPLGLLANLIVVPLATLALWVGVVAMFLCATPLFSPVAVVFGALLTAMTWTVKGLARLPLTTVAVNVPFAIVLAGASLYAFAALDVARRNETLSMHLQLGHAPNALLDRVQSSR